MIYTLVNAKASRNPHAGLMVIGYYKLNPSDPTEIPQKLVFFNKWPRVTIDATVTEHKLDGTYEYKNGHRTNVVRTFSPKTKNGTYFMGYAPQQLLAERMKLLKKIEE